MSAVVIRILLRYAAGFLVAKGLVSTDMGADLASDPDVMALIEMGVGAVIVAGTEAWYYFARKLGWAK